jgi:hypothetical protein
VVTDRFQETARATAEFAGLAGYRFAVVPHPLADNTDEQVRAKAEEAAHQAVALLTRRGADWSAS